MSTPKKIVIVTGGSSGIGKATLDLLRQDGHTVYNLDIKNPEAGDPYFITCNMANRNEVQAAVAAVYKKEQRIDWLFANAGVHLFANIEQTSYEQLDSMVAINILGVFCLLKTVLPIMRVQQSGSVVIMGSDQCFIGKGSSAVYGMTKGAVGQLTKSTAIDYAPYNVWVNCICPGTIDTPLLDNAVQQFMAHSGLAAAEVEDLLNKAQPMGRIGKPEEIARSVRFLLSDESSFTTGSLFAVDGGYVCQ